MPRYNRIAKKSLHFIGGFALFFWGLGSNAYAECPVDSHCEYNRYWENHRFLGIGHSGGYLCCSKDFCGGSREDNSNCHGKMFGQ